MRTHHVVADERLHELGDALAAVGHRVVGKVERHGDEVLLVRLKVLYVSKPAQPRPLRTPPAQFFVVTNRINSSRPADAGIGFGRLALSSSLACLMLSISSEVVSAPDLLIMSESA